MSHELICSWLGLPPDCWPPDHYRLLGLPPGENDLALIEQRVHQRLDAVRRYQARHPEQATEAMNRLAQAFVCLTEPAAKKTYDQELLGVAAAPPVPVGIAEVASTPYPDPTQFERKSDYYDPKSPPEEPRWWMVDVRFKRRFARTVSLEDMKARADDFGDFALLRRGNRLSVMPVSAAQYKRILSME